MQAPSSHLAFVFAFKTHLKEGRLQTEEVGSRNIPALPPSRLTSHSWSRLHLTQAPIIWTLKRLYSNWFPLQECFWKTLWCKGINDLGWGLLLLGFATPTSHFFLSSTSHFLLGKKKNAREFGSQKHPFMSHLVTAVMTLVKPQPLRFHL